MKDWRAMARQGFCREVINYRLALATLVVGVTALLTPFAYVSPLDSTWIHGFWDDADYDDVILRIVSDQCVIEPFPDPNRGPGDVVANAALLTDESPVQPWNRSSVTSRAPPGS